MARPPISDELRETIIRLHGQGKSRNAIAREAGCAAATVSKVVKESGGTFERGAEVAAATAAKVADAKTRRAELALKLLDDAERLRRQLFEHATVFNFDKDGEFSKATIDEPTFGDKRNIMQSVSTAVTASIKIDQHDRTGDDPSDFDAWLTHIRGGEQ